MLLDKVPNISLLIQNDIIYLKLENAELMFHVRSLYNAFKGKKKIPPTAQKKFKEKFPQFPVDWKKIYSLPFTVTIETKIREFQYKVLNNIVFTNERLFSAEMFQRLSGKLSILGLVNVKLTFKHLQ